MEKPVNWKSGKADEAWKVIVCARDARRAEDLLQGVAYILDNPGNTNLSGYADVLRRFTGDQIADALLAYHRKCFVAVLNALPDTTDDKAPPQ